MPYIKKERRIEMDKCFPAPETAGELNYVLTRAIQSYYIVFGSSYQTINDIIGAMENAKWEFQRRVVEPYEKAKALENGDIYD